jgi:hypothetical protein
MLVVDRPLAYRPQAVAPQATFDYLGSRPLSGPRQAVQVLRWLGHRSAAFTLSRYVHLLPGDLGSALALDDELPASGGNGVATEATELDGNDVGAAGTDAPFPLAISDATGASGDVATAS